MERFFSWIASWSAMLLGTWQAFTIAAGACVLWAVSGPLFDYSDTWQLVINTLTTVLTFLAVFLIQNEQNRSGRAVQIKLDELLEAVQDARETLVGIEDEPEPRLLELQEEVRRKAREGAAAAGSDEPAARDAPLATPTEEQ